MRKTVAADAFQEITGAPLPDGYSLIRHLGEGPISRVFLVRNTPLKRFVALKVLRNELAEDPIGRKRFLREAQAAARITHPSVPSIFTVGRLDNDIPFIEMQHVEGRNLADELRGRGPFDVADARKILEQLANALAAAHEHRVIHRAVEPTNVLLGRDGNAVFLTDFGVAGILETGTEAVTKLTRADERLGHPAYMSPEQFRGEPLTAESDIYSFGLLGYEMLTLKGPFGDSEVNDVVGAHIRRPPLTLHEACESIPADISDILKRCLAKKPQNRPTSRNLVEFFSSEPGEHREASTSKDTPLPGAVVGFFGELQDRRVYRAAAAYAAVIFLILQVADLVFPPLNVPDWVYRLVVILSLSTFPLILALAWIFDWQKGRLTRTEDVDGSFTSRASPTQQTMLQALGLIFSIAVSAAIAWWLLSGS